MTRHSPPATGNTAPWYECSAPWESGFFSLMRAVAARHPHAPAPGTARLPGQEPVRLGQQPGMIFPPREIASLNDDDGILKIRLFWPGIWGPNSVFPLHLSEQAYFCTTRQDYGLSDFADIFHHRALSLFYRAWFLCQDTATLDDPHNERFSFYVGCLTGFAPTADHSSPLPRHAQLASAPHLAREARSPDGLTGSLQHYFDLPFRLQEFVLQWIELAREDQSRLGVKNGASRLGEGAILGDTVHDRQHKFRLIVGPLTLQQYLSFIPGGEDMPVLREWVRCFIGVEYSWDVQLVLAADQIPLAQLNGRHQLGHAVWLERENTTQPLAGMCFEPENFAGHSEAGNSCNRQ